MGIYKRAKSRNYYAQFVIDGKTYVRSTKTPNRKLAQQVHDKLRNDIIAQNALGYAEPISVGDALNKFQESKRNDATRANFASSRKHFEAVVRPDKALHDVQTKDVTRLVHSLEQKGLAVSTVRNAVNIVRAAVNYAGTLGYRVPDIKWPSLKPGGKRVEFLSIDQERALLEVLDPERKTRGVAEDDPRRVVMQSNYDLVIALLDLGCRVGEATVLKWKYIDLKNRTIHLWRHKNKTESILRMTDRLYDVMKRRSDGRLHDEWVFPNEALDGPKPTSSHAITNAFKRAGLNGFSVHSLRHTLASRLADAGMSIQKIGKILGHKDLKSTMIYSHLVDDDVASEAVGILNGLNT